MHEVASTRGHRRLLGEPLQPFERSTVSLDDADGLVTRVHRTLISQLESPPRCIPSRVAITQNLGQLNYR